MKFKAFLIFSIFCSTQVFSKSINEYYIEKNEWISPYSMQKKLDELRYKEKMHELKNLKYEFIGGKMPFFIVTYTDIVRIDD